MSTYRRATLAAFVVTIALVPLAVVAVARVDGHEVSGIWTDLGGIWSWVVSMVVASALGALVARRQPSNPLGRVLAAGAVLGLISIPLDAFGSYGVFVLPTPAGPLLLLLGHVAFYMSWAVLGALLPSRFPNGRLLGPRWRYVEWLGLAGGVLCALEIIAPGAFARDDLFGVAPGVRNPVGIAGADALAEMFFATGIFTIFGATFLAGASVVVRYVRSRGDERQQLKWVAYAIVVTIVGGLLLANGANLFANGSLPRRILLNASLPLLVLIPAALAIAVLRYRLYDVDVVIARTATYGVLTTVVVGVYVAIVVGLGHVVGAQGNLALSVVATGVIALGFGPAKDRVQRVVNRWVYGERLSPYEALSTLARRLGSVMGADALHALQETVRRALDDDGAQVLVHLDGEWRDVDGEPVTPEGGEFVAVDDGDVRLGAYVLSRMPSDRRLLADLVASGRVGLSAHGLDVALQARARELEAHTVELAASRRRIVTAADTERRRIERNIHDGAQQTLVGAAVQLRMAAEVAAEEPATARDVVARVRSDLANATGELRELARGIYPAILTDAGLAPALRTLADRSPIPVTVDIDAPRQPPEAEAALYFACAEALQNAAKYSRADHIRLRISTKSGDIVATISDNGVGFDPAALNGRSGTQNMDDRLAALGGRAEITSAPGQGCTVELRVPASGGAP